jgi:hypothetical protein
VIPIEGPIRRTREGGSEWEPAKILLEGDGGSNKMNMASNPHLRQDEHDFQHSKEMGVESKGKEPRRVHTYIPHQIPKRKVLKSLHENHQDRAPKITKKKKREQHIQALRNYAESSIHHKEVHTMSSLLPDRPSLSQDLTMKLSS